MEFASRKRYPHELRTLISVQALALSALFLLPYAVQAQEAVPESCQPCSNFAANTPRTAHITIDSAVDAGRYYTPSSAGSILVGFTALVTFSHPPVNVSQQSFVVGDGEIVQVSVVDACSQVRLRGFVRQDKAWLVAKTNIAISLPSLKDCSGSAFRPASAELQLANRPICTLYTTNMTTTAQGAVLSGTSAGLALACSQTTFGLSKRTVSVSLSQDPVESSPAVGLLPTVLLPAEAPDVPPSEPACDLSAWSIDSISPVTNAQTFYGLSLSLPDCFFGQVTVSLTSPVYSSSAGSSLPLEPLTFCRVNSTRVTTLASGLIKTPVMVDYPVPLPGYSDGTCS